MKRLVLRKPKGQISFFPKRSAPFLRASNRRSWRLLRKQNHISRRDRRKLHIFSLWSPPVLKKKGCYTNWRVPLGQSQLRNRSLRDPGPGFAPAGREKRRPSSVPQGRSPNFILSCDSAHPSGEKQATNPSLRSNPSVCVARRQSPARRAKQSLQKKREKIEANVSLISSRLRTFPLKEGRLLLTSSPERDI